MWYYLLWFSQSNYLKDVSSGAYSLPSLVFDRGITIWLVLMRIQPKYISPLFFFWGGGVSYLPLMSSLISYFVNDNSPSNKTTRSTVNLCVCVIFWGNCSQIEDTDYEQHIKVGQGVPPTGTWCRLLSLSLHIQQPRKWKTKCQYQCQKISLRFIL